MSKTVQFFMQSKTGILNVAQLYLHIGLHHSTVYKCMHKDSTVLLQGSSYVLKIQNLYFYLLLKFFYILF